MSDQQRPDIEALLDELVGGGPFASLEELNRLLARKAAAYNARPQAELGGLSPDEMTQLIYGDWEATGALRLREDLPAAELAGAAFVADARTVLEYVRDAGVVKETAARNLPRAAVAALLPRLRTPTWSRLAAELDAPGPVNEGDVRWLPIVRHVLLFAGLLVRRKGLRIGTRGRALLSEDRAGELYALLFRTLFRQLDLRALGRDDRHPGLQQTVAYSFYTLRTCARDWSSPEALAAAAWLESAKDPPTEWEAANVDFRHWAFRHRVLDPLVQFALLEERVLPTEEKWIERVEMRTTPLFDRFLRFDLRGAPPPVT